MWFKVLLVGLLIGLMFIAISINAQPRIEQQEQIVQKLDQILENQEAMLKHLRFIKNKV